MPTLFPRRAVTRPRRRVALLVAVPIAAAGSLLALNMRSSTDTATPAAGPIPSTSNSICDSAILRSPYRYKGPAGTFRTSGRPRGLPSFGARGTDFPGATKVVVVPAGNNTAAAQGGAYQGAHTVFYFAPGIHTITAVMFTGHDSAYVGGFDPAIGKAVIDGVDGATGGTGRGGSYLTSSKASSGNEVNNTWEYLTVRNYAATQNNAVMGNVNGGASDVGDVYRFNTIGPNQFGRRGDDVAPGRGQSSGGGYAINLADRTRVEYNCLTQNAQGAFNGYGADVTISHNEISRNGLGEYPDNAGPGASPYACGCSGGGKLNFTTNATVTYNFVHDNYNAGIWLDFNNAGADVSYNRVESNWGVGIFYEASYNALIAHNTLVGNGWASHGPWPQGTGGARCFGGVSCRNGLGPVTGAGGGNPYAAIYVANSGGNEELARVTVAGGHRTAVRFAGRILVQGNLLSDNFGGVTVYTDTDRYPGGIDNDSACSVPLNAQSRIYYRQTRVLRANGAAIVGRSVTSHEGARTYCSFYGTRSRDDGTQEVRSQRPDVGMAVYDLGSGELLGHVATAASAQTFALDRPVGALARRDLLLSAYGGCGPADYAGGGPGRTSGRPAARYWDNCLWGSRNVIVSGNVFSLRADHVADCRAATRCGYMQAVAFNAGVPPLVRYFQGYPKLIANAVGGLGNVWSANTYVWQGSGKWLFEAGDQGHVVSRGEWQAAPHRQDAGSAFGGALPRPAPSAGSGGQPVNAAPTQ
jgi:parallel beta-helix repeat protein